MRPKQEEETNFGGWNIYIFSKLGGWNWVRFFSFFLLRFFSLFSIQNGSLSDEISSTFKTFNHFVIIWITLWCPPTNKKDEKAEMKKKLYSVRRIFEKEVKRKFSLLENFKKINKFAQKSHQIHGNFVLSWWRICSGCDWTTIYQFLIANAN